MNKQIKAMFPGSFDPIHDGHIDVIKRASKIFDKLYVVVSTNIYKKSSSHYERIASTKKVIDKLHLPNVIVTGNKGLTVNFAKKHHISVIIRGIRDQKDAIYEINMAKVNNVLNNKIETMIMLPRENLKKLSSTAIRYLDDIQNKKVKK